MSFVPAGGWTAAVMLLAGHEYFVVILDHFNVDVISSSPSKQQ